MSTGKGTLALYDIAKLTGADKPILFPAYPNHVFMFTLDVIPDYSHYVLWYGISKEQWTSRLQWLTTLLTKVDFRIRDLYEGLRNDLAMELSKDVDYSKTKVPVELHQICSATLVVHKFLHPESPIGGLIRQRCGLNQLEVIAQAVAPRSCELCHRPFVMDGGMRNVIDKDLWKSKGNCTCDANFCKECLFRCVASTSTVEIGSAKLAKCPGCTKPVIVTCYTDFLDHVTKEYEEHLAEEAANAAADAKKSKQ